MKRIKTKYPGVYYIIGTSRTTGQQENIYYINYRKPGKRIEEKAGRQFLDDMTSAKANRIRSMRIEGKQLSNEERRKKDSELKLVRNVWTLDKLWNKYHYQKSEEGIKSLITDACRYKKHLYVLQRDDFFHLGAPVRYMDFGTDTKIYAYILREGETRAPESIQYAYDQAIKGQWIQWDHMKVGMTAGESLDAMVKAMEKEGYIYTPFNDDGDDYLLVQKKLANTNKSGFSIDNHAFGNNRNNGDSDILNRIGPSMAPFRQDRHHLVIQENNFFAFEYMVHTNLPERPGYPLSINVCNVQIISNRGVEWLQPPNEKIELIF